MLPVPGGGDTLTFVCYIESFLALNFSHQKYQQIPRKMRVYFAIPQTYQDYTLQPMMLTKISNETVKFTVIPLLTQGVCL